MNKLTGRQEKEAKIKELRDSISAIYDLAIRGKMLLLTEGQGTLSTEQFTTIGKQAVTEVCQLFVKVGLFEEKSIE